jgi:hypothetical protein
MYHTTYFCDIEELIKTNTFRLNSNDLGEMYRGYEPPIFKKYPYFMSTARIPNNHFVNNHPGDASRITLELDAAKLSDHGYIIRPINYFIKSEKQESEDRVLSKKEKIEKFNQYIKSFHLYLEPPDIKYAHESKINKEYFNDVIQTIIDTGKPAYGYMNRRDFFSLNRAKRQPISDYLIP